MYPDNRRVDTNTTPPHSGFFIFQSGQAVRTLALSLCPPNFDMVHILSTLGRASMATHTDFDIVLDDVGNIADYCREFAAYANDLERVNGMASSDPDKREEYISLLESSENELGYMAQHLANARKQVKSELARVRGK